MKQIKKDFTTSKRKKVVSKKIKATHNLEEMEKSGIFKGRGEDIIFVPQVGEYKGFNTTKIASFST